MVYILLASGFEESEALVPADLLRRAGMETALVSLEGELVPGGHAITVKADLALDQVDLTRADMLVLPGGGVGVENLGKDPRVEALVRAAAERNIWLAAICAAPTLLARHRLIGVGNYAVCYPGMEDLLTAVGVTPSMEDAVILDETLITSKAPGTVFDFALSLLEVLTDADTAARIQADLHYGV